MGLMYAVLAKMEEGTEIAKYVQDGKASLFPLRAKQEAQKFLNTLSKEELNTLKNSGKNSTEQDVKICEIIGKKLGLNKEEIQNNLFELSMIADTLLCSTEGEYGFGHDDKYTKNKNYCLREIVAQTMNSGLTKNNFVGKIFPETQKEVTN